MDIKDKIRLIRESKGFTQEDIADKLGVTRANYRYFENRGNKLTIEQLENISSALEVSMGEILGLTLPKNDSLEVEQLRKRNEELEDRVKDKTSLLNNITETIEKRQYRLFLSLSTIILAIASQKNILKIRLYKEKYGSVEEEIDKDILRGTLYENSKGYKYKTYFIDQNDVIRLKSAVVESQDMKAFYLIHFIFSDDSEDKEKYFEKTFGKCVEWINTELWVDYDSIQI